MNTQQVVEPQSVSPDEGRSPVYAAIVLIVVGLMTLIDGADAQSLSIAAPLLAEALAISSAGVGLMFSCAALGSAVGYVVGGLLADRWGAKVVVTLSALVIGIFQIATAYVGDATTLLIVRFVVSVGLGGAVPGLFAIISQVVPQRLQYRIQGLIWACFPLGVLSGGVVNGWILNHGHWQTIFIVGGVAPLLVALALWSIGPASEKSENATRRNALFAAAPILKGLWLRVALTGAIFFFSNGAIAVVMNWTPSLLVHAGYTAAVGAHALSWNAAGALISMMLTGFIVERSKIVPIVFGLIASTVVIVLISLFIHSLLLVTLLLVVLGSVLGLSGTAAVFLAGTLFPGGHQASGIGLCMAIGRGGQMIFPAVIGLLLQAGNSPSTTLLLIAILPAGGALAASALALQPRSRSAGR